MTDESEFKRTTKKTVEPDAVTDPMVEGILSSCCAAAVEPMDSGNSHAPTGRLLCTECGNACGAVFAKDLG